MRNPSPSQVRKSKRGYLISIFRVTGFGLLSRSTLANARAGLLLGDIFFARNAFFTVRPDPFLPISAFTAGSFVVDR